MDAEIQIKKGILMENIANKPNTEKENEVLVGEKGLWKGLHFKRERFKIMRKIVAHVTTQSWDQVPHCSFNYEPDVTDFMEEYKTLKSNNIHEQNITLNSLMLKVIVEGLKAAPDLNAYVQYNKVNARGTIDTIEEINISMPLKVDEKNTITIQVQNAHKKSLAEISSYVTEVGRASCRERV